MSTPEDPHSHLAASQPPVSDYDFWMIRKGERLGTKLTGYVRVMFFEEAEYMKQTGKSLSEEWFEVWDGLLPPIVYGLIESNTGKNQQYQHVLFISAEIAETASINVSDHHPQYGRMYPAVFLNKIKYRGVMPSAVVDLTELVKAKLHTLPPIKRKEKVGAWRYAGIARERAV